MDLAGDHKTISKTINRRFAWVLAGLSSGPNHPFDIELFGSDEASVTPTVGAIVPGWLLVVPRTEVLSFASLTIDARKRIGDLIETVKSAMAAFDGKLYLFEHGAGQKESAMGCGVDQAHLHLACLQVDLSRAALEQRDGISWSSVDAAEPWSQIPKDQEYYLVSDFSQAYVGYPRQSESQHFRRLIARAVGRPQEWDYRRYQNERNVLKAIGLLNNRGIERAIGQGVRAA